MGVINLNEQLKALEPETIVLMNESDKDVTLTVVGKLVILTAKSKGGSSTISLGTIPEKYRPAKLLFTTYQVFALQTLYNGYMTVTTAGVITAYTTGGSTSGYNYCGQLLWTI